MKKRLWILCAAALCAMLCACAAEAEKPGQTSGAAPGPGKISDYFPAPADTLYAYQGTGGESASYDVYIDYKENGRFQQRSLSEGAAVVRVIDVTDDQAAVVLTQEDVFWRQNLLGQTDSAPEVLLKTPLETGTTWMLNGARFRTITNTVAQVETPSGLYDAIEVTTEGPEGKTLDYYASGVGLVKSASPGEGGAVVSALGAIETDVPLVQTVRFYYPNIEDGKLYYVVTDIPFYTNDITRKVLAKAYKEPPPGALGRVFSSGTEINSLYLNRDGMVYIDLNKAFRQEMNAGAAYEQMILQSVANTFGHYYGASRVVLTIDNQPYESGHIVLGPGEYLTVNDENTAPYGPGG